MFGHCIHMDIKINIHINRQQPITNRSCNHLLNSQDCVDFHKSMFISRLKWVLKTEKKCESDPIHTYKTYEINWRQDFHTNKIQNCSSSPVTPFNDNCREKNSGLIRMMKKWPDHFPMLLSPCSCFASCPTSVERRSLAGAAAWRVARTVVGHSVGSLGW